MIRREYVSPQNYADGVQKRKGKIRMSIYAEDVFIGCRSVCEEAITTFYLILSFGY